MGRWGSYLLPLIGLAIFVIIVSGTGVGKILSTFGEISPTRLLLFPVFVVVVVLFRGFRWQYLMRMVGIQLSLRRSSSIWAIGFFAAAITPGKVGDAIRALYVSREADKNLGESFLTVFMDRLMDLLVVILLGMVTTLLFSYYYMKIPSIWIIFLSSLVFFVLLFLLLNRSFMKKLIKPIYNAFFPKKHKEKMSLSFNSFYDSLGLYIKEWRRTLYALLLTIIFWLMAFGFAWYVSFIMGVDVGFYYLFIIMPMVTLVEILPISVAGLGTREAACIYFFSVVGISSAQAVGFSIAYLLFGTYLVALVGFIFWLRNPVKLRE